MAKLKHMVGQKVIDGLKGVIDFYYYMGIPCVRKWPKKYGGDLAPAVRENNLLFTTCASLWPLLSDSVREAYEAMAIGTNLTGKDMFFRGYLSGILRYYEPVDDMPE